MGTRGLLTPVHLGPRIAAPMPPARPSATKATVRRLRPETTYLVYATGEGFAFRLMSVLFSVFLIVELGLGPLQLLLMGTVLELSYLLFEVPTGVVADTVSRRLSVVIGLVGSGAAFILLGLSGSFAVAMVSQAMWGVFATFQSGADVAWLTDEIGEEAAQPMYLRGEQWGQVGALVGIVAGVAIAAVTDLRTPILLSGSGVRRARRVHVARDARGRVRAGTPGGRASASLARARRCGKASRPCEPITCCC